MNIILFAILVLGFASSSWADMFAMPPVFKDPDIQCWLAEPVVVEYQNRQCHYLALKFKMDNQPEEMTENEYTKKAVS